MIFLILESPQTKCNSSPSDYGNGRSLKNGYLNTKTGVSGWLDANEMSVVFVI